MDNIDNLKIIIEDIKPSILGLHTVFKVSVNNTDERDFSSFLKPEKIKNLNNKKILDLAWDNIESDVHGWLNAFTICKKLSDFRGQEYKPS